MRRAIASAALALQGEVLIEVAAVAHAGQGIEVLCRFRYINHADDPNACYYDDFSVVALRDIWPGEEITHDYSCQNG